MEQKAEWQTARFNWASRFFVLAFLLIAIPAQSGEDGKHVLILNSFDTYASPYIVPKSIFRERLQELLDEPVSFHEISLESNWGDSDIKKHMVLEAVNELYSDPSPDLVVAMGPPAANFWLNIRDSLDHDVPLIAIGGENRFSRSRFQPGDAGVVSALNIAEFIENILVVKPQTAHVLMVFGSSGYERSLAQLARSQVRSYEDRIDFEYTNDTSVEEMQKTLAGLGEESAVFFGQLNYDVSGRSLQPGSGLSIVRAASSAPVFGALSEQLGQGIVGGRLIDLEGMGETISITAKTILQGKPDDVLWEFVGLAPPRYDWRELKYFSIDQRLLPESSIVEFIPESFWETHRYLVTVTLFVLLVQSLLIAMLWISRRGQRRLQHIQANLGGKLISAHEDQRKAIARELHDDLSQRLTRLSIDATIIGSKLEDEQYSSSMEKLRRDLVEVSKDVHDMSYWLHPSILDDLGLESALRTEVEQISRHCDAELVVNIHTQDEPITPDAALCLFRIAQEALQNCIRHANASRIELELTQDHGNLHLSVSDNGKGFLTVDKDDRVGIGLSSMSERAKLLGSRLKVRSAPGRGTIIEVSIPSGGVNP